MESNKTICKMCNQLKERIADGKFFNGRDKRWRDENGRMWNGRTCPDCNKLRARGTMKKTRVKKKEIKYLEKAIESLKNS